MKNDQDQFNILRKLDKNISQRELATDLGFSLGKLNYLINELKKKGLIKIKRFKRNNWACSRNSERNVSTQTTVNSRVLMILKYKCLDHLGKSGGSPESLYLMTLIV